MSYSSYIRGNVIKWLGIVVIIMIFIPIFGYNGTIGPIWAYFVDINWEDGLNMSRYHFTQMDMGIYIAFFQLVLGIILVLLGKTMTSEFRTRMGL